MSLDIVKILQKDLNCNSDTLEENIELLKIQYLKKSNKLKVIVKSRENLNQSVQSKIKSIVNKKLGDFFNIDLICYRDISNVSLKEISEDYWIQLVDVISSYIPVCRDFLLRSSRKVEGDIINISSGNEFICNLLKNKSIEKLMARSVRNIFGVNCSVTLNYNESLNMENYLEESQKEDKKYIEDILNCKNVSDGNGVGPQKFKQNGRNKIPSRESENSDRGNIIVGKSINGDITDIRSITEVSKSIVIKGDIFKREIIETKTGRKIITFYITDYTSSIIVKLFPRPKDADRLIDEIKEGLFCMVRGEVVNDIYARELVIMARDIVKTRKKIKQDNAPKKRVELHLHTQMSAMDAVSSASSLIERAANWNHRAIAITDHGVVQAYPEAMEAAKKNDIKIIYGIESYLVDDGVPITINGDDRTLDDTYVIFDIETTGFSSINDSIIEIGAVKIKGGEVVGKFSEFVNPERKIPYRIVELTGITDEMVENCSNIKSILPEFMKFIGDSVVVAHNANFDVGFIKKNCSDLNLKFQNPVMDTIPLCKFLFPELKKFKLNIVAKHLGISLENHHRAVDDAGATCDILLQCFKILRERDILNLGRLNEEFLKNIDIKKQTMYHLIILVKNQTGLKNLYKLVSKSNLDYFFKKPRMPKSLITRYRDGLIIGSACEAGQVYKEVLSGKSDEELKDMLSFYDYLEIQPIGNNMFLVKNGLVKDENELKDINRRICELAEKNNMPVVATCDVHFMDPEDEVFRRIIMSGQGYSDADNQPPLYFRTTEEMLSEFQYLGREKAEEVVVENTNKIADMIGEVKPIPDETFPPKIEGAEEQIKSMTLKKVHSIYGEKLPEIVQERLDRELNSIINNGYAVLYLIAEKLVAKSYKDGYLVGSRGSVGSSLVATMSNITEVNGLPPHYVCPKCKYSEFFTDGSIGAGVDMPEKNCPKCGEKLKRDGYDIPFETFLGFAGDKEPDIDLNFSGEYQPVVHKYTEVLFGQGHVFRAGTIGTIAEKTAYGYVKKYLSEKNMIVPQAEVERLTRGCTGIKRTTGQHPGGVMVVPSDNEIYNFTPVQHPADDNDTDIITTHFDYHSISGRLLKLDILGHDDPTVLRMLQDLTGIDPKTIPLGDHKVMSLFTSTDALGVTKEELGCPVGTYGLPEFGTKFVRQMLLDTHPKTFSDLVRISGLSHGTDVWINNAQYYIKEGYTTLKDCIACRDDIMMYLLHKGLPPKMSFTIMEKVRKGKGLKEEYEKEMRKHGVPDWYIESCKKIKYMFPKGHAVAYVMMAVRIAYFKVYYPKAYYATYFTVRADEFDADIVAQGEDAIEKKRDELYGMGNNATQKDKGLITILELCYEMYKRGIKFLKVDLYKSSADRFLIEEEGIRIPINALAGVGENAAKNIVEAREKGEFISKEDLRMRAGVSKTVIETLDRYGALRGMSETNQLSLFA
ncbi:PolC-type DNA polymerase III [Clostridium luticellarii]|uniref:DNA polymerase III PolC-type n=1 Tax=Clostridium luticellarii TaxID=1691940 RepID=A0A2T0BR76_9CLOT|nr:PolC-type DNA polymerase III [Clostridium luticellarii]MCI1943910.1 PolC-type DNA polymerase III [Clostridium luticellarii]MCI1967171.1 PolC-type DNA polymerase III [Clostridium luticellarii]MCI1994538.1 PolC-type DNA polymerase III [Clostridium luticellarii]MCI2038509.1 PolC-type DNA polymerase III [Clostridium luticellarii]PRR86384.1 DNA polymerase III PolC-type [Clostridium luticellarii]